MGMGTRVVPWWGGGGGGGGGGEVKIGRGKASAANVAMEKGCMAFFFFWEVERFGSE